MSSERPAPPGWARRLLGGSPRRRLVAVTMIVVGGVITLALAWIVVTGLLARGRLQDARHDLSVLRKDLVAGDMVRARATLQDFRAKAAGAHQLTTGPVWAAAAGLPGGAPLGTARTITTQVDRLSRAALRDLVGAGDSLDPASLRTAAGGIDVDRIAGARPALDDATASLAAAATALAERPANTWMSEVDTARTELIGEVAGLRRTVASADLAVRVLPPMLGAHGVQRYFVAFQNEAEARGTGGIPGAFGILAADHGRLSFERFEPDSTLQHVRVTQDYGPGYAQLFRGAGTTSLYVNTNLSPHYPYAAQTWIAMWRAYSGQRLDGAIAVDPTALSYLLKVTGAARLPDGGAVNAQNVVARTESEVYARFPRQDQNPARKQYLLQIARAISDRLLDPHADAVRLLRAFGQAAGERRLLVYSAQPAIEAQLERTPLAGSIPTTRDPYVGLSVVNDGGNKLDYYLDRSLRWQAVGCGATRQVTVTMQFHNDAPAGGLSPYVTIRSDRRTYAVRPGDNRLEISYYATAGALLQSVSVDAKASVATIGADRGHPVFTVDLELPRATTRTVTLMLREPTSAAAPVVLRQPLVRPLIVRVAAQACG